MRKRVHVLLTGMRQKSATQFGGVARLSRFVVPEVMILVYDLFIHVKFMVSMLERRQKTKVPRPHPALVRVRVSEPG